MNINRPTGPRFADRAIWLAGGGTDDGHVGFRADLDLDRPTKITIMIQAAAGFRLWVDGCLVAAGPLRYAPALPEYHTQHRALDAGRHPIAVQADDGGLLGRVHNGLPSFLWVQVTDTGGAEIDLAWSARRLDEYAATGLRSSPLLDRLEWLDRPLDPGWRTDAPGDGWTRAGPVDDLDGLLGPATPAVVDLPEWPCIPVAEIGRGNYRDSFTGYRFDDPAVQFLLADTEPGPDDDHDGVWFRYDLGRTRIGGLEFTVSAEQDAEITVGYADRLGPRDEVAPVVPLSTGPTRMIQHFATRAGSSRVEPFGALGARWVEVRVASAGAVELTDVGFRDRDLLGEPRGSFRCGDPVLERIWQVGLDTVRSCAEDALVDSVRERGEWVGDVAAAGVDLLAVGWGDQRLVHRALLHAAACARPDGMVAGCVPGEPIHVGTYAAQWLSCCVRVAEQQADTAILRELEGAARANVTALLDSITEQGESELLWSFVDWGHLAGDGPDPAVLLHVLLGLDAWASWQRLLGITADPAVLRRHDRLRQLLHTMINTDCPDYHVATLGYLAGMVDLEVAAPIVREHLLGGFPFDPAAPRLRDPGRTDRSVVTPYFTNLSMPVLLDAGETDLVLDLWRHGWGWMLHQGADTWWEVFDDRWSRCHFWSGSPTWQISRYLLGARFEFVDGRRTLGVEVTPGSLAECSGSLPVGTDGLLEIDWRRDGDVIDYAVRTDRPLPVGTPAGTRWLDAGRTVLRLTRVEPGRFVITP